MYKFIKTPDQGVDSATIEMTLPAELTWPEMQEYFHDFLRGCGFVLPSEEDYEITVTPGTASGVGHGPYESLEELESLRAFGANYDAMCPDSDVT